MREVLGDGSLSGLPALFRLVAVVDLQELVICDVDMEGDKKGVRKG